MDKHCTIAMQGLQVKPQHLFSPPAQKHHTEVPLGWPFQVSLLGALSRTTWLLFPVSRAMLVPLPVQRVTLCTPSLLCLHITIAGMESPPPAQGMQVYTPSGGTVARIQPLPQLTSCWGIAKRDLAKSKPKSHCKHTAPFENPMQIFAPK